MYPWWISLSATAIVRLIHEDAAPFTKRMVTRNNQAAYFVSMGDQLEQPPPVSALFRLA